MQINISLALPTYNNPSCLKLGIEYLIENQFLSLFKAEIIVIDDGSKSPKLIADITSKYPVKLIRLDKNQGKGGAIFEAAKTARGKYFIYTDADCPYSFESIEDVIHNLNNNDLDCVLGSRICQSNYYRNISFSRKVSSKLFNLISNIILRLKSIDNQCGLKGFKMSSFHKIIKNPVTKRFAFDAELIYRAKALNFKITSIPVNLRIKGNSSVNLYIDGIIMIKDLIKIKLFSLRNLKR